MRIKNFHRYEKESLIKRLRRDGYKRGKLNCSCFIDVVTKFFVFCSLISSHSLKEKYESPSHLVIFAAKWNYN